MKRLKLKEEAFSNGTRKSRTNAEAQTIPFKSSGTVECHGRSKTNGIMSSRDKQLLDIRLDEVLEKRRLDQALNAKEFAVLLGVSYSVARAWFRESGFPVVRGLVFWQDFVDWRRTLNGLASGAKADDRPLRAQQPGIRSPSKRSDMSIQAERMFSETAPKPL